MKKKLFMLATILGLFANCLWAVERVKPTMPESSTIEEGKEYYLWNEDAELFFGTDITLSITSPLQLSFVQLSNGYYYINRNKGQGDYPHLYIYNNVLQWGYYTYSGNSVQFQINRLTDGLYTIQRTLDFNLYEFLGSGSQEGSTIYANVNSASDLFYKWRIIPSDNVEAARMMLYLMLEKTDSTYITQPYDELLQTSNNHDELTRAAREVGEMLKNNVYSTPSWSDYQLSFINDPDNPATMTSSGWENYIRDPTNRIRTIVDIKEDATLYYKAYTDNDKGNYGDCTYHNKLKVYIDGDLVRVIEKEQLPNSRWKDSYYPHQTNYRFFEKLSKGIHTIEWEYECNENNNYNYYRYLNDIGILNTGSEVSVSLKEPGSLGTEILAQVNSVKDVHCLKIKGEMNSSDWETIDLITELVQLDLSEAIITNIPNSKFYDHTWLCKVKLPEGLTHIGNNAFRNTLIEDLQLPSTIYEIGDYAFYKSHVRQLQASHTQLDKIGAYAFCDCMHLTDVVMPTDSMTSIIDWCFANSRFIVDVRLPKRIQNIATHAFAYNNRIKKIVLPEYLESMGTDAFYGLLSLESDIIYPIGLDYVPAYAFQYCNKVNKIHIPEGVTSIGSYAFDDAYELDSLIIPEGVTSIGSYAFAGSGASKVIFPNSLKTISNNAFEDAKIDSLILPEGVSLGKEAFYNCYRMKYAELPTTYYNIDVTGLLESCDSLNHIKIKTPTKLYGNTGNFISWPNNVTLEVPDYLVNSYKLDSYWYTYKDVIGFATSEVDNWVINNPITLESGARLQGAPNVELNRTTLTMKGESGMQLNNFNIELWNTYGYYKNNKYYYNKYGGSSQVLSSANIEVTGDLSIDYYSRGNDWCYIALPFDIKVSDIQTTAQYAIRYYDGALRAANLQNTGNWKDYAPDDIIPAGIGFIYQTSKDVWSRFIAYENDNKNRALSANDIATPLNVNACDNTEHRGWNLVGNPWMTYFNIHTIDFTAPITVYDASNNTYKAYSIIDDDVALHPTQAFFVQCPDDLDYINFPARGRQLSSVVTGQNGAPTRSVIANRQLLDLNLKRDNISDNTRIVINEMADLGYDYGYDASKFFSEGDAIQLYTTDLENTAYAINERPHNNRAITLAFITPDAGNYTLSIIRNQIGSVILKDLYLNTEVDLSMSDYEFNSEAGNFTNRFQIVLKSNTTNIKDYSQEYVFTIMKDGIKASQYVTVYSVDGKIVAQGDGIIPLIKGVYVVKSTVGNSQIVVE